MNSYQVSTFMSVLAGSGQAGATLICMETGSLEGGVNSRGEGPDPETLAHSTRSKGPGG